MVATDIQINFQAPASCRKWPSLNSERLTETRHPGPYLLFDGSLDECIQQASEVLMLIGEQMARIA